MANGLGLMMIVLLAFSRGVFTEGFSVSLDETWLKVRGIF
jgi:hypothetical protein